jgi:SnoaL-like domain
MTTAQPDAETAHAIAQVLYRYCRGIDRMDADMTLACFASDAVLDYASLYKGDPGGFVRWLWPIHAAMKGHTHSISNIFLEQTAERLQTSEAYVMTTLRMSLTDNLVDLVSTGRYLDRWKNSSTGWVIDRRTYLSDLTTVRPVVSADLSQTLPRLPGPHPVRVARDRGDLSYELLAK